MPDQEIRACCDELREHLKYRRSFHTALVQAETYCFSAETLKKQK